MSAVSQEIIAPLLCFLVQSVSHKKWGRVTLTCCKTSKGAEQKQNFWITDDPVSPLQGWEQETPVKRAKEVSDTSVWWVHPVMIRVRILKPAPVPSQSPPVLPSDQTPLMLMLPMFFFIYLAGFSFILSIFKCFSSSNEALWDVHQCCTCFHVERRFMTPDAAQFLRPRWDCSNSTTANRNLMVDDEWVMMNYCNILCRNRRGARVIIHQELLNSSYAAKKTLAG